MTTANAKTPNARLGPDQAGMSACYAGGPAKEPWGGISERTATALRDYVERFRASVRGRSSSRPAASR